MKKLLFFILCSVSILFCTSCSNGYNRAIKNYTGPTHLETTSCDTKITYDFEFLKDSRYYLTSHKNYEELGYTCWTSSPGWTNKHAESYARNLVAI